MKIIIEPDGYAAHIIKPNRTVWTVKDPENPFEPEMSVWLVKQAMDRHQGGQPTLSAVRAQVSRTMQDCGWRDGRNLRLMADVHIKCALDFPGTPYAIRYTSTYRDDVPPFAIYRGEFFTCEPDGSLTPWGERDPSAPTPEQWWDAHEAAARYVKAARS